MTLRRGLIVAPSWIGDAVLAQPLFQRLQERHPGLVLDALAPRWVTPVLSRMDEIGEVLDNPFAHGELNLKARWALGRQLAARGYDAAWVLPNSLKSALVTAFAGIPLRVGFTGEARYGLLNCRHTLDKSATPLMVERFAQLAEAPGRQPPRPIAPPRLHSREADQMRTLAALGLERPSRLLVCCPGAEYGPAKRWPEAHYASLARAAAAQGWTVWLLGSHKDGPVGESIAQAADGCARNLCGATSLDQAIDLLALADHVVCNDSGLMHVAAALGRSLTALYGSSSPGFTPPLSERATVLQLGLECSPCFKRKCPLGHFKCLQDLEPLRVLDTLPR